MKFLKKAVLSVLILCAVLFCADQSVSAATISVSAGQSSVKVGNTVAFTVRVPSNSQSWTYTVKWSDNLTYISGETEPDRKSVV